KTKRAGFHLGVRGHDRALEPGDMSPGKKRRPVAALQIFAAFSPRFCTQKLSSIKLNQGELSRSSHIPTPHVAPKPWRRRNKNKNYQTNPFLCPSSKALRKRNAQPETRNRL